MRSAVVAERYARALLCVAKERQQTEAVREQVGVLMAAGHGREGGISALCQILDVPKIAPAEKDAMVARLFEGDAGRIIAGLIHLVRRKGRTGCLPDVFRRYPELLDGERGVLKGRLTLPCPLPPALHARLTSHLESSMGRSLDLLVEENPDILGGFVFSTETRLLDASIRTALARMSASFTVAAVC